MTEDHIDPLLTKEYFDSLSRQDRPDTLFDNFPDTIDETSNITDIITSNKEFTYLIAHKDKIIIAFNPIKTDDNSNCKFLVSKQHNFETQVANLKPDSSTEKTSPPEQIPTIDLDQIIKDKGKSITTQEDIIKEAQTDTYQTKQTFPPNFCLIPNYLISTLLGIKQDNSSSTPNPNEFSAQSIFTNLYNTISPIEEIQEDTADEPDESIKQITEDIDRINTFLVPFLSQFITHEANPNQKINSITHNIRKTNKNSSSEQNTFLQNFLLDKEHWHTQQTEDDDTESEEAYKQQTENNTNDLSEDEVTDDENGPMFLTDTIPSFHKRKPNFPTSTEEPSKVAKRAEELSNRAEMFNNNITLASDPQTIMRDILMKEAVSKKSIWLSLDEGHKRHIYKHSIQTNGIQRNYICEPLLKILSETKDQSIVAQELLASNNNNRSNIHKEFEPLDTNTIKSILSSTMFNTGLIKSLNEIKGLSFFMSVPLAKKNFSSFKSKNSQLLYYNADSFRLTIEQMKESTLTVAQIFSHFPAYIFQPSTAHNITGYNSNEESAIAVLMRDQVEELEAIEDDIDNLILQHGRAFANFLAIQIHNSFVVAIKDLLQHGNIHKTNMKTGLEDKIKRGTYTFSTTPSTHNKHKNNNKRDNYNDYKRDNHDNRDNYHRDNNNRNQHHNNYSNNRDSSRDRYYDNSRNDRGDRNDRTNQHNNKGFFQFDDHQTKEAVFDRSKRDNLRNLPKVNGKPVCFRCTFFGDSSCKGSNDANTPLFHGPFNLSHEPQMKTFANANNLNISKRGA
jgi:hypothetical protein